MQRRRQYEGGWRESGEEKGSEGEGGWRSLASVASAAEKVTAAVAWESVPSGFRLHRPLDSFSRLCHSQSHTCLLRLCHKEEERRGKTSERADTDAAARGK